jgi:hypothetical protein
VHCSRLIWFVSRLALLVHNTTMEEDLYDEFGNYIGPDIADSDEVRRCGDVRQDK